MGLEKVGNKPEKIAKILGLSLRAVKKVLDDSNLDVPITKDAKTPFTYGEDNFDITEKLLKYGQKGLDRIIKQRAAEVRKLGFCTEKTEHLPCSKKAN